MMICTICGAKLPDAHTLGQHIMRDHGIVQMAIWPTKGLEVMYGTLHPR